MLHWVAGDLSMQVDVGPRGASYLWVGLPDGGSKTTTEITEMRRVAQRYLAEISGVANTSDPDWAAHLQQHVR